MRRFGHKQRTARRKFDWDSAIFNAIGFADDPSGPIGAWLRVPAGSFDSQYGPVGDNIPLDDTLIKTKVALRGLLSFPAIDPDFFMMNRVIFHAGIIRWPSAFSDDLPPAEVPSPRNGSYDWVWRYSMPYWLRGFPDEFNISGGVDADIDLQFADAVWVESSAQRKLSSGEGLLLCLDMEQVGAGNVNADTPLFYMVGDVRFLLKLS